MKIVGILERGLREQVYRLLRLLVIVASELVNYVGAVNIYKYI